jgi:hypothetical protein
MLSTRPPIQDNHNNNSTLDILQCTLAKWEPIHGKFRFRHPWSEYQTLGTLCRQCAATTEALASYVAILAKYQVIINC